LDHVEPDLRSDTIVQKLGFGPKNIFCDTHPSSNSKKFQLNNSRPKQTSRYNSPTTSIVGSKLFQTEGGSVTPKNKKIKNKN
jgi:hypothetical protein